MATENREARRMKGREPGIERAAAEAERLYRAAVRRYLRAVPVVCNPRVARAAESLKEAGRMVERAIRLLARPVYRRLGLKGERDAGTLCHILHNLDALDWKVADHCPGMLAYVLERLPERGHLDKWLVRDGRTLLDAFARIGRLDLDSDEGRRLRALVRVKFAYLLPGEGQEGRGRRRTGGRGRRRGAKTS